eukprot:3941175-Rhodomonas_salina.1
MTPPPPDLRGTDTAFDLGGGADCAWDPQHHARGRAQRCGSHVSWIPLRVTQIPAKLGPIPLLLTQIPANQPKHPSFSVSVAVPSPTLSLSLSLFLSAPPSTRSRNREPSTPPKP